MSNKKHTTYFYYDNGNFYEEDAFTLERKVLDKSIFNNRTHGLPFFTRGTHIFTINGEIMQKVFFKERGTT